MLDKIWFVHERFIDTAGEQLPAGLLLRVRQRRSECTPPDFNVQLARHSRQDLVCARMLHLTHNLADMLNKIWPMHKRFI